MPDKLTGPFLVLDAFCGLFLVTYVLCVQARSNHEVLRPLLHFGDYELASFAPFATFALLN